MAVPVPGRSNRTNYPPLIMAGLVMVLLLAVMPSALNLPQTNPSQTLEYAPVPPEDDQVNPPVGNFSSLGLGSSGSVGGSNGEGGALPPGNGAASGVGKNPVTKQCSGSPPKQTADPLAPPCVPFYEGSNGGATYRGVTADEIRILIYLGGYFIDCVTQEGCEERPGETYFDLDEPPKGEEQFMVRQFRIWQRYFNDRYQTYGRRVHFFLYFDDATTTPERRKADAAANLGTVKPFAVQAYAANSDPYIESMARAGVLNFGSMANKPASFFAKFPRLIWGYLPSIEQQAGSYASWVCTQIVNRPVSFSGNPSDQGKPRRLAMVSTTDKDYPGMQLFARAAKEKIQACGGEFVAQGTFPYANNFQDSRSTGEYAFTQVAEFIDKGVTTVIWPQGYETNYSKAAGHANWRPEWVIAGDGTHEGYATGQKQDQTVWNHAWVMTPVVAKGAVRDSYCYQAQAEDPSHNDTDTVLDCGGYTFYQDLRQLFTGIQVAGPRLTPESIDEGFRAIPAVPSSDPSVPACFYLPGDYTCVKDGMVNWYDSEGVAPGRNEPGCWRMIEKGLRYFAGRWPDRDAAAARTPGDPCNGHAGGLFIRAGAPGS